MRRQKFRRDKMLNGSSSNKSATYYSLSKPKNCCLEGDILYHQFSHSTGFTFDYKKMVLKMSIVYSYEGFLSTTAIADKLQYVELFSHIGYFFLTENNSI